MMNIQRLITLVVFAGALSICAGCASTQKHESTGEYMDDAGITAKVKTAILKEPGLKVTQIDVNTYKGTVQLSGFVDSQDEIRKAGQVASGVHGVKSVINNISVKPK